MKHLTQEDLILLHYREAAGRADAQEHVAGCRECRDRLEALGVLLAAIELPPVPDRPADYGTQVWQRIRPRLESPAPGWGFDWRAMFRPQRLALGGAMAGLLVVAFLAGRFWQERRVPAAGPVPLEVRERILLVAVGEHLERSEMVLVELVNAPSNGTVDISGEQRWAEELVDANRLYRQTAARAGEAGVASVLEELERVLLEIARGPSQVSRAELERIRERMEARGILFKVRVLGSQMRRREMGVGRSAGRAIS